MRLRLLLFCAALCGTAHAATPAPDGAQALVDAVAQAAYSSGFRLHAELSLADGDPQQIWRMFIAGINQPGQQQLLIRALLPKAYSGRTVIVHRDGSQPASIASYGGGDAPGLHDSLFGSGLSAWDLLGAWWRWPAQQRVGSDKLLGKDCVVVDSSGGSGPVARVRSCISPQLRMPLRLEFFDAAGRRLQGIDVLSVKRRRDGSGMASALNLTDAQGRITAFKVYSGSDHAELPPDLFDLPEHADGQR